VAETFVQKISKKTERCTLHQERLFGAYLPLYQADKAEEVCPEVFVALWHWQFKSSKAVNIGL